MKIGCRSPGCSRTLTDLVKKALRGGIINSRSAGKRMKKQRILWVVLEGGQLAG